MLTLDRILAAPHLATATFERDGQSFTIRPLCETDAQMLAEYFAGFSPQTRIWFAPHKFTPETALDLCTNQLRDNTLRTIALTETAEMDKPAIVAYFILQLGVRAPDKARFASYGIDLQDGTDCTLAPSVADDWQGFGLGTSVMQHVIGLARKTGKTRVVLFGGVDAENERAIRFYEKFGFRRVATFGADVRKHHDMILDIGPR